LVIKLNQDSTVHTNIKLVNCTETSELKLETYEIKAQYASTK